MAAYLKFDPATGAHLACEITWSQWLELQAKLPRPDQVAVLYDPWTGRLRKAQEVDKACDSGALYDDLREAVRAGDSDAYWKILEQRSCGIEASLDQLDNTAILIAAARGHANLVRELIERGADVRATNANDVSFMHFAAKNDDVLPLALLSAASEDMNSVDRTGTTPLMGAIILPTVIDLDAPNLSGSLAPDYDYASAPSLLQRVRLLLAHGALVNVTNHYGRTALMNAERLAYAPLCELLVAQGASTSIMCNGGKTAVDYRPDAPSGPVVMTNGSEGAVFH